MTIAVKTGNNFWTLSKDNQFADFIALPGDIVSFLSESENETQSPFSKFISKIEVDPLPVVQGHTVVVRIYTKEPAIISGKLGEKALNFFQDQSLDFIMHLQGYQR